MTTYTLGGLKATIADDLARDDLTTQIADAIDTAITKRKVTRYYFNETRTATFVTVADQSNYASADDADIPLFLELDGVFLTDSDGNVYPLDQADILELQWLLGNGAATGRPYCYAYYNSAFVLYPIPDDVYTITPVGHIEVATPASDSEAGNAWMTEAFEMLRSDAKAYLYAHVIKDKEQASIADAVSGSARAVLNSATNRRVATGNIERTSF